MFSYTYAYNYSSSQDINGKQLRDFCYINFKMYYIIYLRDYDLK